MVGNLGCDVTTTMPYPGYWKLTEAPSLMNRLGNLLHCDHSIATQNRMGFVVVPAYHPGLAIIFNAALLTDTATPHLGVNSSALITDIF